MALGDTFSHDSQSKVPYGTQRGSAEAVLQHRTGGNSEEGGEQSSFCNPGWLCNGPLELRVGGRQALREAGSLALALPFHSSYVNGVVSFVADLFPAGRASISILQGVAEALATENMATLCGDDEASVLHDL